MSTFAHNGSQTVVSRKVAVKKLRMVCPTGIHLAPSCDPCGRLNTARPLRMHGRARSLSTTGDTLADLSAGSGGLLDNNLALTITASHHVLGSVRPVDTGCPVGATDAAVVAAVRVSGRARPAVSRNALAVSTASHPHTGRA